MDPKLNDDELTALRAENARLISLLESNDIEWRLAPQTPTQEPSRLSPAEKITVFRRLFRGREDVYSIRWESKNTGKSGYAPACANEWRPGICAKPRIKASKRSPVISCSTTGVKWKPKWRACLAKSTSLGYSHRFHVFAAPCQDAEHTYESLVQAFGYFGGSVKTVLIDNQKAAVLKHENTGEIIFNAGFQSLAKQYGFIPRACRPHQPRTKGKVKRMVGYVKHNFFVHYRRFDSFAYVNQPLTQWLAQEADLMFFVSCEIIGAGRRYQNERNEENTICLIVAQAGVSV